jgi:Flp pilus assembly protein TadB
MRSSSSNEAELLVSELLIKYKIKNFNIEEAIDAVLETKGLVSTRQMLSKLLIKLRSTRIDSDIRDATQIFAYSIDTNWARMLASNIYQSSRNGINVSLSLEDILVQLRVARTLKEERKRETAEPRRMFYSIPIFFFVLFVMSVKFMGIDFPHYMKNQFGTPQGLFMFGLAVMGFLITYFFLSLLNNRKFDY